MAFCKTITHVVAPGDTFYRLAQRYQTTVPAIIMRNPGVNPYNLQVGTRLTICSGLDTDQDTNLRQDELGLNNDMRKAWTDHAFWNLIYRNSLFGEMANLDEIQRKMLQSPEDIAEVFSTFFEEPVMLRLNQLLNEHQKLTEDAMLTLQEGNRERTEMLENQLHQNADATARLLSSANPQYSYEELARDMNQHIDGMMRMAMAAMNGNWGEEIRLFDENENMLMEFADYLTEGMLKQFYPTKDR